jgi:hypothetical protein
MKKRVATYVMLSVLSVLLMVAGDNWLHIYQNTWSFHSIDFDKIRSISYGNQVMSTTDGERGYTTMTITDVDGEQTAVIDMASIDSCVVAAQVPIIYVSTPDNLDRTEVDSRDVYIDALLSVEGNGAVDDISDMPIQFKGRGNSTWFYPKKPYRIKAAKKFSLCGLKKAKSYVLIANYIDCQLMRNAVAFWIAQRLGMPYTNHSIPVMVYFNNDFKGAYMLTEKVGINSGSVDIDETKGMLFELDANYDEEYKFMYSWTTGNRNYSIPVMVKDPDLNEIAALAATDSVTADALMARWQADFTHFADVVTGSSAVGNLSPVLDIESAVNYLLVNAICGNQELVHPKSAYLYKTDIDNDVYHFGPVWDFDWAFTWYGVGYETDDSYNAKLFNSNGRYSGSTFFTSIARNAAVLAAFKKRLNDFIENDYPDLLAYINEYAARIESSAKLNGLKWPTDVNPPAVSTFEFRENVERLKVWLDNRLNYMKNNSTGGLY